MLEPVFTDDVNNLTDENCSPVAQNPLTYLSRMKDLKSRLEGARRSIESDPVRMTKIVWTVLCCAEGEIPYTDDVDNPNFKQAANRLSLKTSVVEVTGQKTYAIDPTKLATLRPIALYLTDLAIETLDAGELAARALYKANQPLVTNARADNLPVIELARVITEGATAFFRGRLF